MKYRHRDRANRAVPILCAIVFGALDLTFVAGGPALPWGARVVVLLILALAALVASAAVPHPERLGWVILFTAFGVLTACPPERLMPSRLIFGALFLAGLLGLLVWHARQKRTALWSGS